MTAETWVEAIETLFRHMNCPEDQVNCASYVLRGEACWISIISQGNPFFSVRGNFLQEVVGRKIKCVKITKREKG